MSTSGFASLYRKGKLRGDLDSTAEAGRGYNTVNAGHHGSLLAMHSKAPPPVTEYEGWLASVLSADPRGKTKLTGVKLRRMVVMRRNGETLTSIGRAVGISPPVARKWLMSLPEGLAA